MKRDAIPTENDIDAWLDTLPAAEQKARSRGTFFTDMHVFWETVAVENIQDNWYDAIVRTSAQGPRLSPETVNQRNLVCDVYNGNASSDATNTIQTRTTKVDSFHNMGSGRAHCLSHAPLSSKAFCHMAEAATGCVDYGPGRRLKLMNGVKSGGEKIQLTGLKHHRFNKFYLERHREEFDSTPPKLAVFPTMGVGSVLDWDGVADYEICCHHFWRKPSMPS